MYGYKGVVLHIVLLSLYSTRKSDVKIDSVKITGFLHN